MDWPTVSGRLLRPSHSPKTNPAYYFYYAPASPSFSSSSQVAEIPSPRLAHLTFDRIRIYLNISQRRSTHMKHVIVCLCPCVCVCVLFFFPVPWHPSGPSCVGVPSITGKLALCEVIKVEASVPTPHISHLSCCEPRPAARAGLSARADDTRCQCLFIMWTLAIRQSRCRIVADALLILLHVRIQECKVFPPDEDQDYVYKCVLFDWRC